jgi:hypothetical protein
MKTKTTWGGTSLFAFLSLAIVACGQAEPAKDPSSSTMTTAAEPKKSAPEAKPVAEEAKPAAEPVATPAPAAAPVEEKAEPCPQEWVCVNVDYATGKITKRDTKLIGDPKVEQTWSKSVDTRAPASFEQGSKGVEIGMRMPQTKAGEHLYQVFFKVKGGREIMLDKHTGEEVTYVGVIAAEKDGQFMVDLRYMK